ncbi:unnamed protein product [Linum tenue]|uniref:Uncharacterized protein n=1 Tax=Linum tenue TaxID=586396 RepID=A0AAV0I8M8_9ROSI|nr:unnamed protein product [Linum tenue]
MLINKSYSEETEWVKLKFPAQVVIIYLIAPSLIFIGWITLPTLPTSVLETPKPNSRRLQHTQTIWS